MKSLIQNIITFLGFGQASTNKDKEENIVLWEDDYLMVEIMSSRNIEFAKQEILRISKFGQSNFDGNGYTEITEISEKPFKTKDLNISKQELILSLEKAGLTQIPKIYYNGEPKPLKHPKTMVYGKFNSGIFVESENDYIKNLWFATYNPKDINRTNIKAGLKLIGEQFSLIMVNWHRDEIINLCNENEIDRYFNLENE